MEATGAGGHGREQSAGEGQRGREACAGAQRQLRAHPGLSLQLRVEAGALQPLHDPGDGEGQPPLRVQHRGPGPDRPGRLRRRTARYPATAAAAPPCGCVRPGSGAALKGSPAAAPPWRGREPPEP